MMQHSIERFKKTISNLTDVVKLQKDNSQPAITVNLSEITDEIILDMKQMVEFANATIQTFIDCEVSIYFSKSNLRSILYNLISNAIKYRSPERSPLVQIHCNDESDDFVILKVQDNGLGMDVNDQNTIFKMFHRLHDHVEGTGVGLFMVKRIVENAGGKIEVESKLGEGSVFTVCLNKAHS